MYPRSKNVKNELVGPTIGEYAKIGANSTILPDLQIEDNAIIGAGAVVTKDISKDYIVFGNPARELEKNE